MSLYSVEKALSFRFFRSFFMELHIFFVFSFIIFCPQNGQAAEVTFFWEANTESYLAGYKIYVGNSSRTYKYAVDAGNHTTHTLSFPSDGQTYYFAVTAYGTGENESDYSNELSWTSPYSNEVDTDGDGLSDTDEIDVYGTDPEDSDTDNDGFTDGYEVWNSFDPNNPDSRPQQDDVIIIDNSDPGTTSDGSWKLSEGENPYDSNSLYSKDVGDTYTFAALVDGSYQVSLWWTEWSNRLTDVPVEIYDGDTLIDVIKVNQQVNGGKWNLLGIYEFSGKVSVVIVSEGDGSTSADAVRLIPSSIEEDEVIIDNGDSGTESDGNWKLSVGENPYEGNSLYSKDVGDTYTFEALVDGSYQVFLWWTEWSSRLTDVPIEIYDGDTLIDVIKVNQQLNGGKWNLLGTYEFSEKASVVVVSEGDGSTSADAVRLIPQY